MAAAWLRAEQVAAEIMRIAIERGGTGAADAQPLTADEFALVARGGADERSDALFDCLIATVRQRDAQDARWRALVGELAPFTQHAQGCPLRTNVTMLGCTCELDALLAQAALDGGA